MKEKIKLLNGDCLKLIKSIPDKSIDLILTDPPYQTTSFKWDENIIDETFFKELLRVIKPNHPIVLFGIDPFSTYIKSIGIKLNVYKYDIKWIKKTSANFFNCRVRPLKRHEDIMIFSEGTASAGRERNMPYYPQGVLEGKVVKQRLSFETNINKKKGNYSVSRPSMKEERMTKGSNYPSDVVHFGLDKEKLHPTQKPIALLEYLIKTYTLPGETVLDFTMGSGSTGVACINTDRVFFGIEKNKDYFKIAKKRIEESFDQEKKAA